MASTQEPIGLGEKPFDPETALRFPVGVMSPLWFTFFGAAATASTWWWLTRWTREFALNGAAGAVAAGGMPTVPVEAATFAPTDDVAEDAAEAAAETVAEAAGLVIDPVMEAPVAVAPEPTTLAATAEAAVETAKANGDAAVDAMTQAADDLTRLVGVGPKLAASLAERGVTSFAQIAAWNAEQLAEVDQALNLRGRAVRDAWIKQAKQLTH